MKAYYIHWNYSAFADDVLYYGGTDDDKLFHHKENAVNYAEKRMKDYRKYSDYDEYCEIESKSRGEWYGEHCPYLSPEEEDYYHNFCGCNDNPVSYDVYEREIVFEDAE